MRIIYCADQTYRHGGAEKILIQKMNYWVEFYNYDVLLITTQQLGKESFLPLNEKIKTIDLGVDYQEGVSYLHPKNISKFPKQFSRLKKAISDFNPDAVFVVSLGFVRYALPMLFPKYLIFNEYHTSYFGFKISFDKLSALGKIKKRITDASVAMIESFYTKIIFLNEEELNYFRKSNGIIIPNLCDEIQFNPSTIKKKQVISLGRLSHEKGYDRLIEAWEIVHKAAPDWQLAIYGHGAIREELNQLVRSKNLESAITIYDATNNVNEKLAESAFYVSSSRVETFPMVVLEAMSNHLPVVAFDCPTGIRSIIKDNEDGILVKNGDIEALAEKILMLINDQKLRLAMGEVAAENVRRFNPKTIMAKWNELLSIKPAFS